MKKYLSFFPSNCDEEPPRRLPVTDPIDRREESLLDLLPESNAQAVRHVQADPRRSSITATSSTSSRGSRAASSPASRASAGRAGRASSPTSRTGSAASSTNDSADKAARFIQICDAFNVPLVFLQDVPGFMVGSKVEHAGIIRHGAKMLHVMSAATVPEDHRRRPQGVRRRLLRDVRPRLRAGPHRVVADGARSA